MYNFYDVNDAANPKDFVKSALEFKSHQADQKGAGKTLVMLFFNSSLRTRLSTEIAARKLGMDVICMDMASSWGWEIQEGAVMNANAAEHIKEAANVVSSYADIIAIRSFPSLTDRQADYDDILLKTFMQYATVPVINMESSILHPLQSLTDMMTISEFKQKQNPKVVLSWAPHLKALPQAVSNSFLQWCHATDLSVTVTHPVGYALADRFMDGHCYESDQAKAFANADFVYVKNWSSYESYGQILSQDESWRIDGEKMEWTNNGRFMHCLPIRRNVVATDEVLDHEQSLIYAQAANRLHAAQYVINQLL